MIHSQKKERFTQRNKAWRPHKEQIAQRGHDDDQTQAIDDDEWRAALLPSVST